MFQPSWYICSNIKTNSPSYLEQSFNSHDIFVDRVQVELSDYLYEYPFTFYCPKIDVFSTLLTLIFDLGPASPFPDEPPFPLFEIERVPYIYTINVKYRWQSVLFRDKFPLRSHIYVEVPDYQPLYLANMHSREQRDSLKFTILFSSPVDTSYAFLFLLGTYTKEEEEAICKNQGRIGIDSFR
jgi:hypothetical protein